MMVREWKFWPRLWLWLTTKRCRRCHGTGTMRWVDYYYGEDRWSKCRRCDGTGRLS